MIQYGLISNVDARCLEWVLDFLCDENEEINYCEIGLYNGRTTSGVKEYVESKRKKINIIGIDNFADDEKLKFFPDGANLVIGNSVETAYLIDEETQDLIFVDANHSFPSVIADFFCYQEKVKKGGYMIFHDSGKHIQEYYDYQRMGNYKDPRMYICVREALTKIGLLDNKYEGWELVFDEADKTNPAGGVCVFKKK